MAMPDVKPVIRVVPESIYTSALRLAYELAHELRRLCTDPIHAKQVQEIEKMMFEAGIELPANADCTRDTMEYLTATLDPQLKSVRYGAGGRKDAERVYHDQDLEVSSTIYRLCKVGLSLKVKNARAHLVLKQRGYGRGHVLRFAFADLIDA